MKLMAISYLFKEEEMEEDWSVYMYGFIILMILFVFNVFNVFNVFKVFNVFNVFKIFKIK